MSVITKTIYTCDACGKEVKDPYSAKMKEFYVGTDFDFDFNFVLPVNTHRKVAIHLCDACFHSLKDIAALAIDKTESRKKGFN